MGLNTNSGSVAFISNRVNQRYLMRATIECGYKVVCFSARSQSDDFESGVEVIKYEGFKGGLFFIFDLFSAFKALKRVSPELVVLKGINYKSYVWHLASTLLRVKTIAYHQNGIYISRRNRRYWYLQGVRLSAFLGLFPRVGYSPSIGNPSCRTKPLPSHIFVPFAVVSESSSCLDPSVFSQEGFKIVFVTKRQGKPVHVSKDKEWFRKRADLFSKAVSKLSSLYRVEILVAIKNGDDQHVDHMRELLNSDGFKGVCHIKPSIPNDILKKYMKQASLFVLASEKESAAWSHLESFQSGTPVVVTSDNGTSIGYVAPPRGKIFKSGDCSDLFHAMRFFAESDTNVLKGRKDALDFVNHELDPKRVATSVLSLAGLEPWRNLMH